MGQKFLDEYKYMINNIINDLYRNTEYWGRSSDGIRGVVKPINKMDDPNWSYLNFINTNYNVRDGVIVPEIGIRINTSESSSENPNNRKFLDELWNRRHELFSPNSKVLEKMITIISRSRRKGEKTESSVKLALESLKDIRVSVTSKAGGIKDLVGEDLYIQSTNNLILSGTAQVKPFTGIKKTEQGWVIDSRLERDYATDYLIFGKESGPEVHIALFINYPHNIVQTPNHTIISESDCVVFINYNKDTKTSKVKWC